MFTVWNSVKEEKFTHWGGIHLGNGNSWSMRILGTWDFFGVSDCVSSLLVGHSPLEDQSIESELLERTFQLRTTFHPVLQWAIWNDWKTPFLQASLHEYMFLADRLECQLSSNPVKFGNCVLSRYSLSMALPLTLLVHRVRWSCLLTLI